MSRRLVSLTLDALGELPRRCRGCVFWELDPIAAQDAYEVGDPALEKEAWVSETLLEWGSCGRLAYVESTPAGYVLYAPPRHLPRHTAFASGPVSADAALLATLFVVPAYAGTGLGRMLVQGAARDLARRGFRAVEAFGDARPGEPAEPGVPTGRCLVPAGFFLGVGFKTVRAHPRYPRLRLELRTTTTLHSDVERALDTLLESLPPPVPQLRPAPRVPAGTPAGHQPG